jgi:hypothetical protein
MGATRLTVRPNMLSDLIGRSRRASHKSHPTRVSVFMGGCAPATPKEGP